MEYLPLKQKYMKINEEISSIYELLTKFHENVSKIKNNKLKNEIQNFKSNFECYYNRFIGLKRFSIPVFGKISSGKSTLLNYILNLHGIFETNYNISTKFICIIRHNPNLEIGPKIYNVSVSERGEFIKDGKKIKLYNFEKDDEKIGDIRDIIEERNHYLGNLDFKDSNWKKYFMILETNIPLFNDYNYRYSDLFEFMDVPGLNEFSSENDISEHFYYKELIPFFIYNVGFSLFIFDAEKQESVDSLSIINNIMFQYFNNDPNQLKNSIFILNKIDKVVNPKEELNNFKKILNENLNCHIEKNGFFIGLSALLLFLRRFKYESFIDYLLCIIEEFNNTENINIEEYIIQKMSKDFNISIEEDLNIDDDDELEEEENNLIKQKNFLEIINNNAVKKGLKGELTINNYNYYNDYFITYSHNKKNEELGDQHLNFTSLLTKSVNNTIKEYLDNYQDENLKNKLMKELGLTQEDFKKVDIKESSISLIVDPLSHIQSLQTIIDSLYKIEPNENYIIDLQKKCNETLLDIKEKKLRIPLFGEYSSGKSSLLNTIIGYDFNIIPIDTKVCTNIALIIKYTKDKSNISLFHTFLEKTSQNFYFFKSDKESLAEDSKTINLILYLLNDLYFKYPNNETFQQNIFTFLKNLKKIDIQDRIYCISYLIKVLNDEIPLDLIDDFDLKKVFENLLSNINQNNSSENSDFYKRAFFILNIPIEAFDLMNIPDDFKEKIELLDFPGLDSNNNIFESEVLEHLLYFSDGFIFVNKGNSIMELEKVNNLIKIINLINENKNNEFSFKSCLFVLNRCDEVEINIEESKKEYEKIFQINSREKTLIEMMDMSNKLKDLDNINITKFSNKLYSEFKSFMNRLSDFDNYIKNYEIKIDKKYEGKKYLMFLKKKVYGDVCSISSEKYKIFKNQQIDLTKYQQHFKLFLKDEENKPIICDIIKMYLFMKNSLYESKFYEKSNAKDFFEKFHNQLLVTKLFSEESLKKVVKNYIIETKNIFQLINFNINNKKSGLNFEKKDFENAEKNLNEKNKKYKIIFDKEIDDKYQLMEKEYDILIKNFKDGNFKSYEKSIEETANKINKIKEELQNNLNETFKKFTEELIKELKFIAERIKELEIQKEKNANNINMFESVNNAEKNTFGTLGVIVLSPLLLTGWSLTNEATRPIGLVALGFEIYGLTFVTSTMAAATGGIALGVAGLIHTGFSLYKNITAKGKYIELIEKQKEELKNSSSDIKKKLHKNIETNKKQIESAVRNFERIFFSKNKGLINNKEEWKKIFDKFLELALSLGLLNKN